MQYGPTRIRECPHCGVMIGEATLLSGNTLGGVLWTDGKMEAPMLPDMPPAVICPSCHCGFLWRDAKDHGESSGKERVWSLMGMLFAVAAAISWLVLQQLALPVSLLAAAGAVILVRKLISPAPSQPLAPTESTYLELAKRVDLEPAEELDLRVRALWAANDPSRRPSPEAQIVDASPAQRDNLHVLLEILDPKDDNQRLMIAHIYRQLGQFEECIRLLAGKFKTDRLAEKAAFVQDLARGREWAVRPFPSGDPDWARGS